MYSVELSTKAQDFLNKLDIKERERIEKRLKNLENNPFPSDAKFIGRDNGEKVFRYRLGYFRALYKVKEILKIVLVSKIDKRDRVYN